MIIASSLIVKFLAVTSLVYATSNSCLLLTLYDTFGDGWGDFELILDSPSGNYELISPNCTNNPTVTRICGSNGGLYYIIPSYINDNLPDHSWEILWSAKLEDTNEIYRGSFNTTLVFHFDDTLNKWTLTYWQNLLSSFLSYTCENSEESSCSQLNHEQSTAATSTTYGEHNSHSFISTVVESFNAIKESIKLALYNTMNSKNGDKSLLRRNSAIKLPLNRNTMTPKFLNNNAASGNTITRMTRNTLSTSKKISNRKPWRSSPINAGGISKTRLSQPVDRLNAWRKMIHDNIPKIASMKAAASVASVNSNTIADVNHTVIIQNELNVLFQNYSDDSSSSISSSENKDTVPMQYSDVYTTAEESRNNQQTMGNSIELKVYMYDNSGEGWFLDNYEGTSFYISDESKKYLIAYGSLENGTYSGYCEYCFGEGSYIFRVSASSRNDATWSFCQTSGSHSQQLSFHIKDSQCIPDVLLSLSDICGGDEEESVLTKVTLLGLLQLEGISSEFLNDQQRSTIVNTLSTSVYGWGDPSEITLTTATLNDHAITSSSQRRGLSAFMYDIQFQVTFISEIAYQVDGSSYHAITSLVSEIVASLEASIISGDFALLLQAIATRSNIHTLTEVTGATFGYLSLQDVKYLGGQELIFMGEPVTTSTEITGKEGDDDYMNDDFQEVVDSSSTITDSSINGDIATNTGKDWTTITLFFVLVAVGFVAVVGIFSHILKELYISSLPDSYFHAGQNQKQRNMVVSNPMTVTMTSITANSNHKEGNITL